MAALIPRGFEAETSSSDEASVPRHANPAALMAALTEGRERTLAMFDGFLLVLGPAGLRIAFDPVLNLPLWELGHLGWFEEFWIARNAQRARGIAYGIDCGIDCDTAVDRHASLLPQADALYDSAKVAHAHRWQLALPDVPATTDYLARVRQQTLQCLSDSESSDAALYFFRLAFLHEAMHREAWCFMAQRLGIACAGRSADGPRASALQGEWAVPAGIHTLGHAGPGFAFDNELGVHEVQVAAFRIDRAAVSWQRYLPFIESSARDDPRWWSQPGWAWHQARGQGLPQHLRRIDGQWQQSRFGVWHALDLAAPAMHLSSFEAEAWCCWAGRRLPTEAEWERAATLAPSAGEGFAWGEVWEWTASAFAPYPGFVAHPYREYSQPWFDGRPVLRGASFATDARVKNARYRNFFAVDRTDVFAGFRSCPRR